MVQVFFNFIQEMWASEAEPAFCCLWSIALSFRELLQFLRGGYTCTVVRERIQGFLLSNSEGTAKKFQLGMAHWLESNFYLLVLSVLLLLLSFQRVEVMGLKGAQDSWWVGAVDGTNRCYSLLVVEWVNSGRWSAYQADSYVLCGAGCLDCCWSCTHPGQWRVLHHTPTGALSVVGWALGNCSKVCLLSRVPIKEIVEFQKLTMPFYSNQRCWVTLALCVLHQIPASAVSCASVLLLHCEISKYVYLEEFLLPSLVLSHPPSLCSKLSSSYYNQSEEWRWFEVSPNYVSHRCRWVASAPCALQKKITISVLLG